MRWRSDVKPFLIPNSLRTRPNREKLPRWLLEKLDLAAMGPCRRLLERHVWGLIAVTTPLRCPMPLPLVAVSGHDQVAGFTNIILNHDNAAKLALEHLSALGHERIAFFKGQTSIEDATFRWDSI